MDPGVYAKVTEELEMLEIAGAEFDREMIEAGELTPVFFGSAVNNFGVQLMLDSFLELSPTPKPRVVAGNVIDPESAGFSGFIFKIQANMDPRHRDRLAFVRICSGKFERDMTVTHTRSGRKLRLSSSHKLFGRDRETVDEAYPRMWWGWWGTAISGLATRWPKTLTWFTTRYLGFRRKFSVGCTAQRQRNSNGFEKDWINCCRRGWCKPIP